ncbi:hypothetical protein ACWEJ6_53570 [Nonomuraea sp. NPDC004702]
MEFRLLGPVQAITGDGRQTDLGRPVPADTLITRPRDHQPATARDLPHGYASKLRAHLTTPTGAVDDTPAMPPAHEHGYRLPVARHQGDAHCFHDDLAAARALPPATWPQRCGCCAKRWPTGTPTVVPATTYARPNH